MAEEVFISNFYRTLEYVSRQITEYTKTYKINNKQFKIAVKQLLFEHMWRMHVYRIRILDKQSNQQIALVIKKPPTHFMRRHDCLAEHSSQREIYFYTTVYPSIKDLEKQSRFEKLFIPVPEYITSNGELNNEMIVLKDLIHENFESARWTLDENHCRLIFETYGRFHAALFCWKIQNPQEFNNVANLLDTTFIQERKHSVEDLPWLLKNTLIMLKQRKLLHLARKLHPYLKYFPNILSNAEMYIKNNSVSSCFLHGNCATSNMMFKYSEETNQVEAVRLVGFSSVNFGSPIQDLLNFFYLDLPQTSLHLDKLPSFLDSYYESFSTTMQQLNHDPEQVLSKNKLIEHWKLLARSCMLKSLYVLGCEEEDPSDIAAENETYDFNNQFCALLQHMHNYKIL